MPRTAKPTTITVSSDALERAGRWIQRRDSLLACAPSLQMVTTPAEAAEAAELANAMRQCIADLESERKKVTSPLDRMKKEIMAQERSLRADLETERARLKRLTDQYATRLAAEREAEARRQREAEEAARMEAAKRAAEIEELFGAEADEPAPEMPAATPPPDKLRVEGARVVERWSHWVQDASRVPREYLSVDDAKIRAYLGYCKRMEIKPEIPGVVFEKRMSVE
jgi:hypothetical protein